MPRGAIIAHQGMPRGALIGAHVNIEARTSIYWRARQLYRRARQYNDIQARLYIDARLYIIIGAPRYNYNGAHVIINRRACIYRDARVYIGAHVII